MAQHCVRLPELLEGKVANIVRSDGHVSVAAFLRAAAQNEIKRRSGGVPDAERNVAATLAQHRKELKSIKTALNTQFALLDAFARVMLYCIPEPSGEIHEAAKAQARARHEKLLRMASIILKGEANAPAVEWLNDAEESDEACNEAA